MSDLALTQFLIDVTRGHHAAAFRDDPAAVTAASRLPETLRAAIVAHDIAALWRAGAHPMALLYFSRACGWDGARYYACIAEADATASAPARST